MRTLATRLATLCLSTSFLFASAAPATAAVWVVGPSSIGADFSSIQAAVNAASDGDLIVIDAQMGYGSVTIQNKSLTLVGINGMPSTNTILVRDLAATRNVTLAGLRIQYLVGLGASALTIRNCAGGVLVDGCHIGALSPNTLSSPQAPALKVEQSAAVAVVATQIFSNSVASGVHAIGSTIRLHVSNAIGGVGNMVGTFLTDGGAGLTLTNSTAHAFGCSFTGGKGGSNLDDIIPWLYCTAGGPGAELISSTALVAQECTFTIGMVGTGWDFPPNPPPIDFGTSGNYSEIPGPAVKFNVSRVLTEGSILQLDLGFTPNAAALVWAGSLHAPLPVPGTIGALCVALPATVVSIGAIPPSGHLQAFVNLPFLPPGLDAATLTVQASVFAPAKPVHWSNPAQVTVIDSAL